MVIRYKYLSDTAIIDHEANIHIINPKDILRLSFDNLTDIFGIFAETICKYKGNRENLALVRVNPTSSQFNAGFLFTEKEKKEIDKDNPNFSKYLVKFMDRLALDKDGNLYDIDENEEKTFTWFSYTFYTD